MKQEVIDEIINISSKDKILSVSQIRKILTSIVDDLEHLTQEKYNGVVEGKRYWKDVTGVSTNISRGLICINYGKLMEDILYEKNVNNLSYLGANMSLFQLLLHELEHIRESYKSLINNNDKLLLEYSNIDFILQTFYDRVGKRNYTDEKFRKYYVDIHGIVPCERIANMDSCKKLINLLDGYPNFRKKHDLEYQYILNILYEYETFGYKNKGLIYPLIKYLKEMNIEDVTKLLCFDSTMSTFDKYRYGLYLSKDEAHRNKLLLKK